MTPKESKQPAQPIEEKKAFKRKLQQLEGIQFEILQDYIIALDKL